MRFGGIRNGLNERRFRRHLAHDENSTIDPFQFAKIHKGYLLEPSQGRHIWIEDGCVFTSLSRDFSNGAKHLDVDISYRVDHRNTPKHRGSFVHAISMSIDITDPSNPTITNIAGVVMRQGRRKHQNIHIPDSVHTINVDTLERDLMFLRQSLIDRKDFIKVLDPEKRQCIALAIERFVSDKLASRFPHILETVKTPLRSAPSR
ncbi:MAG: hypothetical protein U0R17_03140 [Acidimicrobiia bacterium]